MEIRRDGLFEKLETNMTTIRERRHRDTLAQLTRAIEHRDAAITKLVKMETRIKTLRRQAQRYEKLALQPKPKVTPPPEPKRAVADVTDIPVTELPIADKLEIPPFLQRSTSREFNPYEAQHKEARKVKTRARIEKMKAKQRGDLKRMPLTGKAALDAIRQA